MNFRSGDKVSWRTVNGHASGTLVREVAEGTKVWAVQMENGNYMPVHENSMQNVANPEFPTLFERSQDA